MKYLFLYNWLLIVDKFQPHYIITFFSNVKKPTLEVICWKTILEFHKLLLVYLKEDFLRFLNNFCFYNLFFTICKQLITFIPNWICAVKNYMNIVLLSSHYEHYELQKTLGRKFEIAAPSLLSKISFTNLVNQIGS